MARIRTIKPDFFRHEKLFELEIETNLPIRVAFAGLWTACDRSGRFIWSPRQLKLDCLPYDEVDFSRVLDALLTRGHIKKYIVDGKEYGFVPSWELHQVINNRETESVLPPPSEESILEPFSTRESRVDDASTTRLKHAQGEGKGREGKGKGREGKGETPFVEQKPLDEVRTIFEFWKKIMKSQKSAFDAKRKAIIVKALKHYSPADLCKAIRGCSKTPYNMGKNDRNTKFNGIDLIFRDADHIDRFIATDGNPKRAGPETDEERSKRIEREFLGNQVQEENTIEMEA